MARRQAKIFSLDFSRINFLPINRRVSRSPLSHGVGNLKAALFIPVSGDKRLARYPA